MSSFLSDLKRIRWRQLARDLLQQVREHRLSIGSAAIAYHLLLSVFPAMIALLTLLPYLPIPHLEQAIMDGLRSALPGQGAAMLEGTVRGVMSQRQGGLLSIGTVAALWAASNGMYALTQQLNLTYEVKEGRGFFKLRGVALLLTVLFGVLIVGAFGLVVLGGFLQAFLGAHLGSGPVLLATFATLRWVIIIIALMLAFAIVYYLGPDVEQEFRWVSPGALLGVIILILAAIGIRIYTDRFAHYDRTYGSIGAVIVLMLWFFVVGYVLMLGSEINSAVEHHAPEGKQKGQKRPGDDAPRATRDRPGQPAAPSRPQAPRPA